MQLCVSVCVCECETHSLTHSHPCRLIGHTHMLRATCINVLSSCLIYTQKTHTFIHNFKEGNDTMHFYFILIGVLSDTRATIWFEFIDLISDTRALFFSLAVFSLVIFIFFFFRCFIFNWIKRTKFWCTSIIYYFKIFSSFDFSGSKPGSRLNLCVYVCAWIKRPNKFVSFWTLLGKCSSPSIYFPIHVCEYWTIHSILGIRTTIINKQNNRLTVFGCSYSFQITSLSANYIFCFSHLNGRRWNYLEIE